MQQEILQIFLHSVHACSGLRTIESKIGVDMNNIEHRVQWQEAPISHYHIDTQTHPWCEKGV